VVCPLDRASIASRFLRENTCCEHFGAKICSVRGPGSSRQNGKRTGGAKGLMTKKALPALMDAWSFASFQLSTHWKYIAAPGGAAVTFVDGDSPALLSISRFLRCESADGCSESLQPCRACLAGHLYNLIRGRGSPRADRTGELSGRSNWQSGRTRNQPCVQGRAIPLHRVVAFEGS
jgi:hypothetical protein